MAVIVDFDGGIDAAVDVDVFGFAVFGDAESEFALRFEVVVQADDIEGYSFSIEIDVLPAAREQGSSLVETLLIS